jgi:NDP-sugar pyrophosphorylase family protein
VYKTLVKENLGHVRAFLCAADFWDVGTPADYLDACLSIGKTEGDVLQIGRGSVIERSAEVTESVIWDDVSVGAGARLERCVVADGVTIPSGASFRNCAIIQRDGELIVADIT